MKDTSNLLDYNQWSAGEYENNTNPFITNTSIIQSSNQYSVIGEQSLKILKKSTTGNHVYTILNYAEHGKVVTLSVMVRSGNEYVNLQFIEQEGNTNIKTSSVKIPANTVSKASTSLTTSNSNTRLRIQFSSADEVDSCIYIDDINLTVS